MANPLSPKGSVNLPVLGHTSKKAAYAYGAAALAVVGIAVWRHRRAMSLAADDPNTAAAGVTGDVTDDGTGGAGYAPSAAYGSDGAASDQYGYGSGAIVGGGNVASDGSGVTTSQHPTTNDAWSQAAIDYLGGIGVDQGPVSAALGKYLAGQNCNDAETALINQAIATQGVPPQSGAQGFPPAIRHVAGTGVTRLSTPVLTVTGSGQSTKLSWGAVKNASYYMVQNLTDNRTAKVTGLSYPVPTSRYNNDSFAVYARNIGGGYQDSVPSNAVHIGGAKVVLSAPHMSESRSGNTVKLSWSAVPNANEYLVHNFTDNRTVVTKSRSYSVPVSSHHGRLFAVQAADSKKAFTSSAWSNQYRIPTK